jgi:spore maturation protein CgeB
MIKFLKVASFYKDYLPSLYQQNPDLALLPFEEQLNVIFSKGFGWADFWKKNLEKNNHFLVKEIIYNAETAQKQWAKENKILYKENDWADLILHAQIAAFEPEIIYFDGMVGNATEYKRKYPFIKYIISWDGVAQHDISHFQGVDIMLSCKNETVQFYQKNNFKAHYFSFGFEKSILEKIEKKPPHINTSFVGSLVVYKGAHKQRLDLLYHLSKHAKLDLWLSNTGNTHFLSIDQLKRAAKGMLSEVYKLNRLARYNRGVAYGLDMYQILSDSKISINTHIDVAGKEAANMRLFEATGVGSCLVTDWKHNLKDFFKEDQEVVSYKSFQECAEKVTWLLQNDQERKRIAMAGQKRTLENYTLEKRINEFVKLIDY